MTVLLFATLAEKLDAEKLEVALPNTVRTVAELLHQLRRRGGAWKDAIDPARLTVTVNRQFAESTIKLRHGDEVSLTPIYPKARN